jgi:hypothetical protein
MGRRSKEQFTKDIQSSSQKERDIIDRFVQQYKRDQGIILIVQDYGCGNSGEFLPSKKINTKVDFMLSGQPVEVKFNNRNLKLFHVKTYQLDSYIKQGASILWVNGYETETPEFTFMRLEDLEWIRDNCPVVHFQPWDYMECYSVESNEFIWLPLKPLERGATNG